MIVHFREKKKKSREKRYLVKKINISNSFKLIFQNSLQLRMQIAGEGVGVSLCCV